MDYDQIFVVFADRIERLLIKWIKIVAMIFVITHLAMQFPLIRQHLSQVEKWEGVRYDEYREIIR